MTRTPVLVVLLVGVSVLPAGVALAEDEGPLADAGLDQRAEVGETVLLDATGSRAPGGEIAGYEWRIETPSGNVVTPADPEDPRTRFVVREPGRYDVTVTVKDGHGSSTSDTLFVFVYGSREVDPDSAQSNPSSMTTDSPNTPANPKEPNLDILAGQYNNLNEKINAPKSPETSDPTSSDEPNSTSNHSSEVMHKDRSFTSVTAEFSHYSEQGTTGFESNNHYKDSTGMGISGIQGWMPDPDAETGPLEGVLYGRESYIVSKINRSGEVAAHHPLTHEGSLKAQEWSKGASTSKTIGYNKHRTKGPSRKALKNFDRVLIRTKISEGAGMLDNLGVSNHFTRSDYESTRSSVDTVSDKSLAATQNAVESTDDAISNIATTAVDSVSSISKKVENTAEDPIDNGTTDNSEKSKGLASWKFL